MKQASKFATYFLPPLAVFLIHQVVKGAGIYERFPNTDILFHYIGGLSIAYTASKVLFHLEPMKLTTLLERIIFLLFIISLTSMAAVSWEFAEFISDRFLHTNLQPSIANTMQDQFLGILGGSTWGIIYLREKEREARLLCKR
jgi:hypothetical protein